jgi:hypothetical protein
MSALKRTTRWSAFAAVLILSVCVSLTPAFSALSGVQEMQSIEESGTVPIRTVSASLDRVIALEPEARVQVIVQYASLPGHVNFEAVVLAGGEIDAELGRVNSLVVTVTGSELESLLDDPNVAWISEKADI